MDKYSYKIIFGCCIVIQIIVGFTLPPIMDMKDKESLKETLFAIYVCIVYNLEGAHFVITPTVFAKLYGAQGGIRVFSVGFTFIAVASLFNIFIIAKFIGSDGWYDLGFNGICYIYAGFSTMGLLILIFVFNEKKVKLKPQRQTLVEVHTKKLAESEVSV